MGPCPLVFGNGRATRKNDRDASFRRQDDALECYTGRRETIDPATVALDPCHALEEGEERLARSILDHLADKWSIRVIYALGRGGRLRFSRLLERVEGASQKLLTKTLRRPVRDGLVTRTMYMEVPPRVEYELSPAGWELLLHVRPPWTWVVENLEGFRAARQRFDSKITKLKCWYSD
jgi:DNA-binding HxlR family transcriptional regulator